MEKVDPNDPRIAYVPVPIEPDKPGHDLDAWLEWSMPQHVVVERYHSTGALQEALDEARALLAQLIANYRQGRGTQILKIIEGIGWSTLGSVGYGNRDTLWVVTFRYERFQLDSQRSVGGGGGGIPANMWTDSTAAKQDFLRNVLGNNDDPWKEKQ